MVNLIWLATALVFIAMCLLLAVLIYKWANNSIDRGAHSSSVTNTREQSSETTE